MKILLTGGTGFLGKNLSPKLKEKYNVVSLGSEIWDLRQQRDCGHMINNHKPDVVIHAAGSVGGILANRENPGKFMYDNLSMGMNIIQECMLRDIKLIMIGTVCSYPKITPIPFNEKDLWNGYPEETNAPYGIAKKTLMKLVEVYHEQYNFKGVNLVPVNMYGKYDTFNTTSSHVIPALIVKIHQAKMSKKDHIELWGTGEASREFLYVDDCAEAISLAIEKDIPPDPINIGTGKEIKIKDVASMICDIIGYDGEIVYDRTKPDGQPRRCLDVTRAKDILGFTAKTSLGEGLEKTIEHFNSRIFNI